MDIAVRPVDRPAIDRPLEVAVFVGSLRRASISAALARTLGGEAPAHLTLGVVEIRDLPLYDPDLEASTPASWLALRHRIRDADALIFITPEYNRSIPGAVKKAIDIGSRPYGDNAWAGKPALVISLSQGTMGGFGAAHHLRQSLVCLDVAAMPAPEVYLPFANRLLDEEGRFVDPLSKTFLVGVLDRFAAWTERLRADVTHRACMQEKRALNA